MKKQVKSIISIVLAFAIILCATNVSIIDTQAASAKKKIVKTFTVKGMYNTRGIDIDLKKDAKVTVTVKIISGPKKYYKYNAVTMSYDNYVEYFNERLEKKQVKKGAKMSATVNSMPTSGNPVWIYANVKNKDSMKIQVTVTSKSAVIRSVKLIKSDNL